MSSKKRIALVGGAIATVLAVGTLSLGVTFGLFSDAGTANSHSFTSGTVSLASPSTYTCDIPTTNLVPGDSGSCSFTVQYTGSVDAHIGLDNTVAGALFSGATPMTATITVNGSANTFANNSSNKFVADDLGASSPTTHTVTVAWTFPSGADNTYQNQTTGNSVSVTVHAVQSAHNGSCSTVGSACAAGTNWS